MTLYLVAHGTTDWDREPARCMGWAEVALNEAGRARARQLGRALAAHGIQLIVTSHLQRARETAVIVREALGGILLIVDPRLADIHQGDWEGRYLSDLAAEEPVAWQASRETPNEFRYPNGETADDQRSRVLAAVRDAARGGCTALLVTHESAIRAVLDLSEAGLPVAGRSANQNGEVLELTGDGLYERIDALLAH